MYASNIILIHCYMIQECSLLANKIVLWIDRPVTSKWEVYNLSGKPSAASLVAFLLYQLWEWACTH